MRNVDHKCAKYPILRKVRKSNKLFNSGNLRICDLQNLFAFRPPKDDKSFLLMLAFPPFRFPNLSLSSVRVRQIEVLPRKASRIRRVDQLERQQKEHGLPFLFMCYVLPRRIRKRREGKIGIVSVNRYSLQYYLAENCKKTLLFELK